jgi:AcrR family transcriptional regulator
MQQSRKLPAGRKEKKNSFIEEHRRRQLIEVAIETIATSGLKEASFAHIAKNAGVSKGVVAYYFKSREVLIDEIMKSIQREVRYNIMKRLNKQMSSMEKLLAYASTFFSFAEENRSMYTAFTELWTTISKKKESNPYGSVAYEECRSYIGKILSDGQKNGEIFVPDIITASTVIQGLIDGVIIQWSLSPSLVDLKKCEKNVIDLIHLYVTKNALYEVPKPTSAASLVMK